MKINDIYRHTETSSRDPENSKVTEQVTRGNQLSIEILSPEVISLFSHENNEQRKAIIT